MNAPTLQIDIERRDGNFSPGDLFHADVRILQAENAAVEAIECSVLWFTVGKGEEDLAVHHFQREEWADSEFASQASVPPIECRLPASPLSYDGVIVKICWCVRVRLFIRGGHEIVLDRPFRLGNVPAAAIVES